MGEQLFNFEGRFITLGQIERIRAERIEAAKPVVKAAAKPKAKVAAKPKEETVIVVDTPVGEVEITEEALVRGEALSEEEKVEAAASATPIEEVVEEVVETAPAKKAKVAAKPKAKKK